MIAAIIFCAAATACAPARGYWQEMHWFVTCVYVEKISWAAFQRRLGRGEEKTGRGGLAGLGGVRTACERIGMKSAKDKWDCEFG